MNKSILEQLCDSKARTKYLRQSIDNIEIKIQKLNENGGICVADSVTCGKKGKKSLGTIIVRGFPYPESQKLHNSLLRRKKQLEQEEQQLLEMITEAEEYISGIENVEMRNIFSMYYIDDLNWVQVAHRMNGLYSSSKRKYTEGSCRRKHERFLEKI